MSCLGSYSAWLVMYSPPLRHFRQTVEEVTTHSQEGQWNTFCKQPCTSLRSCFKPLVYTCSRYSCSSCLSRMLHTIAVSCHTVCRCICSNCLSWLSLIIQAHLLTGCMKVVRNIIVGMWPTAIALSKSIQNDVRDIRQIDKYIIISTATIQEKTIHLVAVVVYITWCLP